MAHVCIELEDLLAHRRHEVVAMERRLADGEPRKVLLRTDQGIEVCTLRLQLHTDLQGNAIYSSATTVATPFERRGQLIARAHSEVDTNGLSLYETLGNMANKLRSHRRLLKRVAAGLQMLAVHDADELYAIRWKLGRGTTQIYSLSGWMDPVLCNIALIHGQQYRVAIALPASIERNFLGGSIPPGVGKSELEAFSPDIRVAVFRLAGMAERQWEHL